MKTQSLLSVVIPCLNESENIIPLHDTLVNVLNQYENYEIIFIDDGSTDSTFNKIIQLSKLNLKVKYIKFSKCFGHQNALKAGLDLAKGDCVITMDADLQHPPYLIQQMVQKWTEGYKVVVAIPTAKHNISFLKKITSKLFYTLFNYISDTQLQEGSSDFKLIDRQIVNIIASIKENDPFIRGLIPWSGFKHFNITYKQGHRKFGKTKFTNNRMFNLASTGLTSFSIKPLRLSLITGFLCSLFSFLYGIFAILASKKISGWTSIIVSVLFIAGVQFIILGIIGEYIGKIFLAIKGRPNYIIEETNVCYSVKTEFHLKSLLPYFYTIVFLFLFFSLKTFCNKAPPTFYN